MNLNRLINRLHPSSPSGFITSLSTNAGSSTSQCVDQQIFSRISLSDITPVSSEDYFLNIDVKENFDIEFKPRNVYTLRNCRVVGSQGDIVCRENKLLNQFTPQNGTGFNHSIFRRRRFGRLKTLRGRTLNLVTPHSTNYYHWLTEAVSNFRTLQDDLESIDNILIPKANKFHFDSLRALNIPESKLIELNGLDQYACEELLIFDYQRAFSASPHAVSWLKSTLLHDKQTSDIEKTNKIYISRNDSSWRRIQNEDLAINLLKRYGFKSVELSTLSFLDQVALFRNASHVVSLHGAGLANLVFADAMTKVLEIHPSRWTSVCYAHLAKNADCKYYFCNANILGLADSEIEKNKQHVPKGLSAQGDKISLPLDKILMCLTDHFGLNEQSAER